MKKTVPIKITFALLSTVAVMAVGAAARQQPQQSGPQLGATTSKSSSASAAPRNSANVLIAPDEDYRIGLGDVIEIKVENAPELSGAFRVASTGAFQMYFVGRVMAKDKTTEEVSQFIADRLRGEYLRNPNVSVVVKEYNSRAFFIQGAVRGPGVFQIEGRPSLLKLITLAGGLAPEHGSHAFIIRQVKQPEADKASAPVATTQQTSTTQQTPTQQTSTQQTAPPADKATDEEEYELLKVNINGLLKGDFDNNMFLEPGDIINIPLADVFFVAGEVNAPGEFPLKEGTTLRQAISMAQGMKFEAATSRGIIFRDDPSGKREEMRIDIGAVMNGKKQDVAIMPNDIIIVPNSQFKSVGGALLRAFGLTTVQRVPVR